MQWSGGTVCGSSSDWDEELLHSWLLWNIFQGRSGNLSVGRKTKPPGKEKKKAVQEQHKKAEEEQRKEGLGSAIPASNKEARARPSGACERRSETLSNGPGTRQSCRRGAAGQGAKGRGWGDEEPTEGKGPAGWLPRAEAWLWHSRRIASDYRKACATYLQLEESSNSSVSASASASQPVKEDDVGAVEQTTLSADNGVSTTGKSEEKSEGEEEEDEEEEITLEVWLVPLRILAHLRFLPISAKPPPWLADLGIHLAIFWASF